MTTTLPHRLTLAQPFGRYPHCPDTLLKCERRTRYRENIHKRPTSDPTDSHRTEALTTRAASPGAILTTTTPRSRAPPPGQQDHHPLIPHARLRQPAKPCQEKYRLTATRGATLLAAW